MGGPRFLHLHRRPNASGLLPGFIMSFDLSGRLAERRAAHLYRQRPLLESPQSVRVKVDGQSFLAFCSNDYLRSEEHTSELQSRPHLVCRLLLEKKKTPPQRPKCSPPT